MRRTSTVRLVPTREEENKLKLLCSLSAKLWNEVNYARRRQFFEKKGVDLESTYKQYYDRYKQLIGSATTQQILNKNNEAWRSFFSLLRKKRRGELPSFITRVSPPGYKKQGSSRALWTVLRNDQYRIEGDKLILRGLGAIGRIEVEFRGLIHLRGKQSRLEIRYIDGRWYAHATFEVEEKMIRGRWVEMPLRPLGSLRAGIDIGINNLLAIYVESGKARLFSGRELKSIAFYFRHRIAEYQSKLNKHGLKTSRQLRRLYDRWRRMARHLINTQVRRAVEWLYHQRVSEVYVGYPKEISQRSGDFYTVNIWHYSYLLRRLQEVAEEYGIKVILVDETYTSSMCPIHGSKECGRRIARGLCKCYVLNKVFNADLVGAYNILIKSISPSPERDRGNGLKTQPRAEQMDVAPNLTTLSGTIAL